MPVFHNPSNLAAGTPSGNAQIPQQIAGQQAWEKRHSDPRFRSFCERYIIERARLFRTDPDGHLEDQWLCLLDARRAYKMVHRVGVTYEDTPDGI